MPAQENFTGLRKEFLESCMEEYITAYKEGRKNESKTDIIRRFFLRFPPEQPDGWEPTQAELDAVKDDAAPAEPIQRELSSMTESERAEYDDSVKKIGERVALIRGQIGRRLDYRRRQILKPSTTGQDGPYVELARLLTATRSDKPRKQPAIMMFKEANEEAIRAVYDDALAQWRVKTGWKEGPKSKNEKAGPATLYNTVLTSEYDKLSEEEKAKWQTKSTEDHQERVEEWINKQVEFSTAPEDRQRCINGLTAFMQPILDAVTEATGWPATFIAGGPEPADAGHLNIINLHSGSTPGHVGMTFGAAMRGPYKSRILPLFGAFLLMCFSPKECAARALAPDASMASLASTLKELGVGGIKGGGMFSQDEIFSDTDVSGPQPDSNEPSAGNSHSQPEDRAWTPPLLMSPTSREHFLPRVPTPPPDSDPLTVPNEPTEPFTAPMSLASQELPTAPLHPSSPSLAAQELPTTPLHPNPATLPIEPAAPLATTVEQNSAPKARPRPKPKPVAVSVPQSHPSVGTTQASAPHITQDLPVESRSFSDHSDPSTQTPQTSSSPHSAHDVPMVASEPRSLSDPLDRTAPLSSHLPANGDAVRAVSPDTAHPRAPSAASVNESAVPTDQPDLSKSLPPPSPRTTRKRKPSTHVEAANEPASKRTRSAGIPAPSTKQTRAPASSGNGSADLSVAKVIVPRGAPEFVAESVAMFRAIQDSPLWVPLVQQWVNREKKKKYHESSALSTGKPKTRPEAVGLWIGQGRRSGFTAPVVDAVDYGTGFAKWYNYIQPSWRKPTGSEGSVSYSPSPKKASWDPLSRTGPNGFLGVVAGLYFWDRCIRALPAVGFREKEKVAEVRALWTAYAKDVSFVLGSMS